MNFFRKLKNLIGLLSVLVLAQFFVGHVAIFSMDNSESSEEESLDGDSKINSEDDPYGFEHMDVQEIFNKFYDYALLRPERRSAKDKKFLKACATFVYADGSTLLHKVLTFIPSNDKEGRKLLKEKKFVVHHLLKNGAKVDDRDAEGNSALHCLTMRATPSKKIACTSTTTSSGCSSVDEANYEKEETIISPFKRVGNLGVDDLNAQNDQGATPLHVAASLANANVGIVQNLLKEGADPLLKDNRGRTPLHRLLANASITEDIKLCNLNVYISICSKNVLGELARAEDHFGKRLIDLALKYHGNNSKIFKIVSALDKRLKPKTMNKK